MNQAPVQTVLVVEDEEPLRKALEFKFTREGFRVITAGDGEEGYRIAVHESPDIILLDIVMPKMDGMTMLKKLRAESEWGKKVPVMFLTNLSPHEDQRMKDIAETEPITFWVKANSTIQDAVDKVRIQLLRPK